MYLVKPMAQTSNLNSGNDIILVKYNLKFLGSGSAYESVSRNFRTESIRKYRLTYDITR
jgi:hypothetical protein